MVRELSIMLRSGVIVIRSLELLASGARDPALREALQSTSRAVLTGASLSQGMQIHPTVFPQILIKLAEVGERSGRLPEVMNRIADFMERQMKVSLKTKAAMTYPCFVFGICMIVVFVLPAFILDGLMSLVRDLHAEVPLPTRILVAVAEVLRQPWAWLLAAGLLAGGVVLYRNLMRSDPWRLARDQALLRLWAIGPVLRETAMAYFALSLQTMYDSGVPILTALREAGKVSGNLALEKAVGRAGEAVAGGLSLHQALRATEFFPASWIHVIAASEESGATARGLAHAARASEEAVFYRLETLISVLEPAMLAVMGFTVGGIALACMAPIMQMLQKLAL